MEPKETNYKDILKTNIILFLCYSVIMTFLFIFVTIIIKYALADVSSIALSIVLSLISAILIFNLIHFICKSSMIESLREISMNKENTENFTKKMNLFFIICAIFSIIICLGYLFIDSIIFSNAIQKAYTQYNFISPEFAEKLVNNIQKNYYSTFWNKTISTIIIELSLVVSFFSLIPYQEKLLKKFNK